MESPGRGGRSLTIRFFTSLFRSIGGSFPSLLARRLSTGDSHSEERSDSERGGGE